MTYSQRIYYGPPLYHNGPNEPAFPPFLQENSPLPYAYSDNTNTWYEGSFSTRGHLGAKRPDVSTGKAESISKAGLSSSVVDSPRNSTSSTQTSGDSMQTLDELFGGFLPSSGISFEDLMKKAPSPMSSGLVSRTNLNGSNSGASSVNLLLTSPSTNSPETPYHQDIYLKTKEQILETINKTGLSSFVVDTPMVMCRGSTFPKTEQSDKNVKVLSAWRTITSNPQFKVRFLFTTPGTESLMTNCRTSTSTRCAHYSRMKPSLMERRWCSSPRGSHISSTRSVPRVVAEQITTHVEQ
jgi:hypothetical protein